MRVWEDWTIDVKNSLMEASALLQKDVFYDAPSCLKNDQTGLFYHPKQISFGPRHFSPSDRTENFCASENFKSEVARRFNGELRGGMESLVEHFKSERMEKLKKNYGIEVIGRLPEKDLSDGLCWMLARDGCFLLQVLEAFEGKEGSGELTVLKHILKRDNHHPLLTEIVKDMFKLENQLPLWVLEDVRKALPERPTEGGLEEVRKAPRKRSTEGVSEEVRKALPERPTEGGLEMVRKALPERSTEEYWFEPALKNLSPIEVKGEAGSRKYKNGIHILQLLGEYMIDHKIDPSPTIEENPQSEADNTAHHKKHFRYIRMLRRVFALIFFLLLFPVLLVWLIVWSVRESYQIYFRGTVEEDDRDVPTIEELHSIGVKFKSLKGKGISRIHFNERKLTLYLPKFTVNDVSEVILRNLLAMETQWEEEEKIITRYVVFMNDLVNTSVDVARLRRGGIIANKLGSDEDVAQLWNSVTVPVTDIPRYEPIDKVSRSINAYRKQWWRVLWAQFWSLHCSKPWLLASLIGGITLLWLTVFQVICLFNRCSKSGIGPME